MERLVGIAAFLVPNVPSTVVLDVFDVIRGTQASISSQLLLKMMAVASVIKVRRSTGCYIWDLKSLLHLALTELRRTFVSLVGVFVEDGAMVLAGILATLDHQ